MSVPAADLLQPAAAAAGAVPAAPSRSVPGWLRTAEIYVPGAVVVAMLFFCFIWPLLYHVPAPVGGSGTLLDINHGPFTPGHVLGTDNTGNDEMSRILYGGRVSFEVAAGVQAIGLVVGGLLGLLAGYAGAWTDAVLMRILDVFIAFPSLVLVLAIADGLGPSELHVIWALAAFSIPAFARVARAAVLQLRDRPFVVAAKMSGTRAWKIMFGHLLPNIMPQLVTFSLLGAGITIILEGALDFLGYGIPPPGASWGNMIASAQNWESAFPYQVYVPSIFLFVTVLALNLMGDGLRARWDAR